VCSCSAANWNCSIVMPERDMLSTISDALIIYNWYHTTDEKTQAVDVLRILSVLCVILDLEHSSLSYYFMDIILCKPFLIWVRFLNDADPTMI
jgi:hypothetical protein